MKRTIKKTYKSRPTFDGAGVALNRVFGNSEVPDFDPFLLLDAFGSDERSKYIKGFPWHPHRGIETITYLLEGSVEHGDSMGNEGLISTGDVQWMTAGSGIIHQEMPKGDKNGRMYGFQLWANLPASHKMMDPRYRDIKSSEIPEISVGNGVKIKIICGSVQDVSGPVKDIITQPEYLDIFMPAHSSYVHNALPGHTYFAYVYKGSDCAFDDTLKGYPEGTAILFNDGDQIEITSKDESVRFLLISGKPIGEPVAWYGPIVMNTEAELELAFEEYEKGTFIKTERKN
jgi:quercetin 2,3-dioxygenase